MSNQFKPGDLALIVSASPGLEQNIGLVVEVVEIKSPATDAYPICVRGEGVVGRRPWGGPTSQVATIWCRPAQLMPLRGDFEPERQKAKEAEPCV